MRPYRNTVSPRLRRKLTIRKKVSGTAARPRLCVFRSANHIYAQIIDDAEGRTIAQCSSLQKEMAGQTEGKKKKEIAKMVGAMIAAKAKEKGVTRVVFDRNGFLYHGRVAMLADGAREGGLEF